MLPEKTHPCRVTSNQLPRLQALLPPGARIMLLAGEYTPQQFRDAFPELNMRNCLYLESEDWDGTASRYALTPDVVSNEAWGCPQHLVAMALAEAANPQYSPEDLYKKLIPQRDLPMSVLTRLMRITARRPEILPESNRCYDWKEIRPALANGGLNLANLVDHIPEPGSPVQPPAE